MEGQLSARLVNVRCSEHLGQRPEYFCCDKLICSLCHTNHSNHDSLMKLEQKSEEIKQGLPLMKENLTDIQTSVETKLRNTESLLRKNDIALKKNKENIHKRIKEVIHYLKEVEVSLKEDCAKRHERVSQILTSAIDQQKSVLDELKVIEVSCERLSSYKSATEIIRVGIKLIKQFKAIETDVHYQQPEIPEFIQPQKLPNKEVLRKVIGTINDGLDMDSDWTTDESEKLEIENHFKWKQKNVGIAPLSTHSAWLYAVDRGGPISLISQNGDIIMENPNLKQRKIEKIFTTKFKNAWVTDLEKCSVKVLRETGELQHRFNVTPFHPFGICPTKSGNFVWICLADKSSFIPELKGRALVVKMTVFGEKNREIESQNGKKFFTFPYRCTENVNEDLYVVDRISETKGQVFIFDKNGHPKGGYIGTTIDKDFDPRDICCNSKGNIVVSDFTNNAIHILQQDGTLERLLKTDSHDFIQPLTVATDNDDRIWVTFYDGNVIIIKYP